MKKYILILIMVCGVFLYGHKAHATLLYSHTAYSFTHSGYYCYGSTDCQLGQTTAWPATPMYVEMMVHVTSTGFINANGYSGVYDAHSNFLEPSDFCNNASDGSLDGGVCTTTYGTTLNKTGDYPIVMEFLSGAMNNSDFKIWVDSFNSGANQYWADTLGGGGFEFAGCIGTTYADVAYCFGGAPAAPPTIGFNFPTDGTTTAPFTTLSATTTNLVASDTYVITEQTQYGNKVIGGVQKQNDGAYFTRFGYVTAFPIIYDNGFGSNFGMVSNISLYDITNSGYFAPGVQIPVASSTIHWNLIPYIHDGQNEFNGTSTILNTDPIYVQASSTSPVVTPWDGGVSNTTTTNPEQNGTSSALCVPPSNVADVAGSGAYVVCYGWNFLVDKIDAGVQGGVNGMYGVMAGVFPFSVPIHLYTDVIQTASSTMASTTRPTISVFLPDTLYNVSTSSRTLVIVSADTTVPYVEDQWFLLQDYLFKVALIMIIVGTVSKHSS